MALKKPSIFKSTHTAFNGIVHVVKSERNARVHLFAAVMALLLGAITEVSNAEMAAIFFSIIIVFVAEVVNTAIERTLDLVKPENNEQVRIVKDIAAGAVLVASIGALGIGVAIFYPYVQEAIWSL